MPEMGEYLVGAYLKLIEGCDLVDYGVRVPDGGMEGLRELDVVGLRLADRQAFLCEVATHLDGLLYGSGPQETIERIRQKYEHQRDYARRYLASFEPRFMLWAPVVSRGPLTEGLAAIEGLQLVINGEYKRRVEALLEKAKRERQLTGNPVFRVFQILGALRD